MFSKFILGVIALLALSAFTAPGNIALLRDEYLKAESNSNAAENLMKLTEGKTDALSKAYRGSAWAFKAKHHFNPVKKLEYVKTGLLILNQAVNIDDKDVEVRFVRFSVEEHIPSMVSFTSHLKEDKKFILTNLKKTHPIFNTIKSYLLKSDNLSEEEKNLLEKV